MPTICAARFSASPWSRPGASACSTFATPAIRAAAAAAAPAATPPAAKTAQAPAVLDKAAARLKGATATGTIKLVVKDPDATYFLALGTGVVDKADAVNATITVADADLADLAAGMAKLQTLYQRGKLRVDGDVNLAHHLALVEGVN